MAYTITLQEMGYAPYSFQPLSNVYETLISLEDVLNYRHDPTLYNRPPGRSPRTRVRPIIFIRAHLQSITIYPKAVNDIAILLDVGTWSPQALLVLRFEG